jgi:Complex I intermediate-associated protein 30 (CIA30)
MTIKRFKYLTVTIILIFVAAHMKSFSCEAFPSYDAIKSVRHCATKSLITQRQAWDPIRFVTQSSKFVSFPSLGKKVGRVVRPGDILWSPGGECNDFKFSPLDDVVMGGVSSSSFDDITGMWNGKVADENNGGFIGIRSYPNVNWDMTMCRGLQIRLKSSQNCRIKLGLRDTAEFNGIVWNTSANVDKSTAARIPFLSLIPNKFANRVTLDKVFNRSNIVGIQFVYSKFEYDGDLNPKFRIGDVKLQILEVTAY